MRLGVLTGGGDVPGLNPCIKTLFNRAEANGWEVLGLRRKRAAKAKGRSPKQRAMPRRPDRFDVSYQALSACWAVKSHPTATPRKEEAKCGDKP